MYNIFADIVDPEKIPQANSFVMADGLTYFLIFLAICLVSTILIETIFAIFLGIRKKNILIVILAQVITNPLVVLVSNYFFYKFDDMIAYDISCAIMEILAFVGEALIYKKFFHKDQNKVNINPFSLSLVLNVLSYSIGLIMSYFSLLNF